MMSSVRAKSVLSTGSCYSRSNNTQDLPFTTKSDVFCPLGHSLCPTWQQEFVIAPGSQAKRTLDLTEVAKDSNTLPTMAVAKAQSQIKQVKMGLTVLTCHSPLHTAISSAEVHFTIKLVNPIKQDQKT